MSALLQLELILDGRTGGREDGKGGASRLPDLPSRLRALGLPAELTVVTHANRRVLVSLSARGALRVHGGYAMAPDDVLLAIARWAGPRTRSADRRVAQKILLAFPVHDHVPSARAPRRLVDPVRPGDERILARLLGLHRELNERHFGGALGEVVLSLSSRMRRRLGEFRPAGRQVGRSAGSPDADLPSCRLADLPEIAISRRHLRRDGWPGVRDTLAHELVHQWQHESGRKLGHDAEFRRRCAVIGIDPRATRRWGNDLPNP